ncbi:MAG: rhamnogalacturonan acetylesterase [Burkholderiales bacterium]|nr:rhamnogalacturonan acetylesterase [Burkholderiales bacterium]
MMRPHSSDRARAAAGAKPWPAQSLMLLRLWRRHRVGRSASVDAPPRQCLGDSTVRNGFDDGQGLGDAGQWGWGNPLAEFVDTRRVNLVNRAIGGLSSRTYRTGGHWQRTLAFVKRGDVVVMQFGHNDASPVNDASRARGTLKGIGADSQAIDNLLTGQPETVLSYGAYLRGYVADIRALGATPVICSPVPFKRWDAAGKVLRAADNYAGWAEAVARSERVAFLDLNAWIAQRYDELGRDAVMDLFQRKLPEDNVHTNRAGARLSAQIVDTGLQQRKLMPADFFSQRLELPSGALREALRLPAEAPRDPRLPTVFIAGDSTVKTSGHGGAYGWGERLAAHFDLQRINVVNHAIGGRSTRTFVSEGRWDALAAQLKAGDWVLIQFGHNDDGRIGDPARKGRPSGAGVGPEVVEDLKPDGSRELVHSFGWYMARFVDEARARGASVVLVSPIPRKYRWAQARDFEDVAAWDQQVAREHGAQFVDLTLLITEGYRQLGAETVYRHFADDAGHTNDLGARYNAARLVDGLRHLPGAPLNAYLLPDAR